MSAAKSWPDGEHGLTFPAEASGPASTESLMPGGSHPARALPGSALPSGKGAT